MGGTKKRARDDASPFRRKKSKRNASASLDTDLEAKSDSVITENVTELLNAQTIREGMLLLGCVTEVRSTFCVMSLPGCLSGIVPVNNVSNAFTKSLKDFAENSNLEEPSLSSIIKVGMVFPCKIIQISREPLKRKLSIKLSINPQDINAELKPSSLYPKMVLFVSVSSIEDHGYIVDAGNKYIQGFLSKHGSDNESKALSIGEVIPTFIKKINFCSKTSANIQLSQLDFNEEFPEVSVEDIKLSSVLPGAKIRADVIEVKHPFVYMKYLCFDACASILSLGSTHKAITVGSTILGTVLYVHPITHMIYLMLNLKPSPEHFDGYFGLKKYNSVKNLKFQYFYKNQAYYKINKGTYGFINTKDLPNKSSTPQSITTNHTVSKACVLCLHYMDNLVEMTAKSSMTEKNITLPEDVQIGDIFDAAVKKHVQDGMLVSICPGLVGFVRRIHMSDVFVTKPEMLHPPGSKIKCRVLSTDGKGKLILTCKESLVNLEDRYILSTYDNIQRGQFYKGVVVKVTNSYILVVFFNDIKGIVTSSYIPKGSVFYEGQTVLCEVLECDPLNKKLRLSLKTEGWCSVEELDDLWDASSESSTNTKGKKTAISKKDASLQTLNKKVSKDDCRSERVNNPDTLSDKSSKNMFVQDWDSQKPVEAVIMKVKGNQLNIMLYSTKGRVHITELGCISEGIYPLREFSAGQKIQVYIIGEHLKRKKNYLEITHRNMISFKECTLNFHSVSLSEDLKPGCSILGFVKKVYDVNVILWLSPTETGVLDYLHFSENPKVVRKLHRHLKVGLSLKVSVLDQQQYSKKEKGTHSIKLTKIEKNLPQVGKNVLGLVQIACIERGLILKLPFDYHGVVAVTDLTDVYIPLHTLFDKYRKLKFLLCHVLEVNHETKYCQLSLRKSRVYGKKMDSCTSFCSEIIQDYVTEGEIVKGFVKSMSDSSLTVAFGRNLEGKVYIHYCTVSDCRLCNNTKSIIAKYPVGSVVEVVIEKKSIDGRSFSLALTDSKNMKRIRHNRLNITEDISWNEE